ncbi:MAG: hypothetical protein A2008_00405 [Candidatus Wallbacteria bacterium GWC2_49_35]|uniref:Phosphoribosylformylglycinamidine cyclo-ligase n=1 Tax=Candidatus Wallbacteria bacterium GWC2_49_35 TaxID=1817813 RepID=A0A1F7WJC4_9BACT|nr:MAG: hypothetical protein A2008_00405 [Candidatus Wallbacteria bacterium GWC2_49_35]HBC74759.1 phosphoribosylformylglycinamidine cyclo-ligase [Candidatus Wallbacteria bacterium]
MEGLAGSGIDISLCNSCSKLAYSWAKKSFANRGGAFGEPISAADGSFSNIMDFGGLKIGMTSDGVGTKVELAERTGIYETLGYDLVAMVADDLACNGIEPACMSNIIDADILEADVIDGLMKGLHEAAKFAGIAVTGGEIAELGKRVAGYGSRMHFNWCATAIGFIPPGSPVIDGKKIVTGDMVISLKSRGFRSNGFSIVRNVMQKTFGNEWHTAKYDDGRVWGEVLLTPSLIYSPLIVEMVKKDLSPKGAAHVTGGGVPDNLSRIIRANGLGADLYDLYDPHAFMLELQKLGRLSDEEAYRSWNMGNGMILIIGRGDSEKAIELIEKKGYSAKIAGVITNDPVIRIQSKGVNSMTLEYDARKGK